MKTLKKKITIGDKIQTNKKFKPLNRNDEAIEIPEEGLPGVVIGSHCSFYIVEFEQPYDFTHYLLDKGAAEPKHAYLKGEWMDVKESLKIEDVGVSTQFIELMIAEKYKMLSQDNSIIKSKESEIESVKSSMRSYQRDMDSYGKNLIIKELELRTIIDRNKFSKVSPESIIKQCKKVIDSEKIKDIVVEGDEGDRRLLITTEDLYFVDKRMDLPTFKLGAFKIRIPLETDGYLVIANYKKQYRKYQYHHPCISSTMKPCFGDMLKDTVHDLRNKHAYIPLIGILLDFLEEPNYGSPHIDAKSFSGAQKVTIAPRDSKNWFNENYRGERESFDEDKFTEYIKEILPNFTGKELTEEQKKEKEEKFKTREDIIEHAEKFEKEIAKYI